MINIYTKTEFGWERSHRTPEDLANHVTKMGLCPAFESMSDGGFALVYVYQTKDTPVVLVSNTPRIGEDITVGIAPQQNWGYARYLDELQFQYIWGKKYPIFKPSMFGRVVLSTPEQVRWCINNK